MEIEGFQKNQDDPPHDAQEMTHRAPERPKIVRIGEREDLVKNSTIIKPKLPKDNQRIYRKFQ